MTIERVPLGSTCALDRRGRARSTRKSIIGLLLALHHLER